MERSLRWALLLALFCSACKKQITSLPQGEELNGVRVELLDGRLHFNSREDFDNFFQLSKERKDNIIAEFGRHEFKSFKPAIKKDQSLAGSVGGCEIDEDQYNAAADFFSTLNTDAVVQIDNDLYKIDLCNQKVYVLAAADNGRSNYNDLVVGNTSNNKVGYFPMYVEATEAVAQGYRTMPDPSTVQDDFLSSHLHMMLNRIFPSNPREQEWILYEFLCRHYASVIARKNVIVSPPA